MRHFTQILALFLVFFFSSSHLKAFVGIQGSWYNPSNEIHLSIEYTTQGIKARRSDQKGWYFYRETRTNVFVDDRGHSYILLEHEEMIYKSRNGALVLYYEKDQPSYYDNSGHNEWLDFMPQIGGNWYSNRNGNRINVREKENGVLIRNGRRTTFFSYEGNNHFVDRRGNSFALKQNGDIVWKGKYSRAGVRFSKRPDRRNGYCD